MACPVWSVNLPIVVDGMDITKPTVSMSEHDLEAVMIISSCIFVALSGLKNEIFYTTLRLTLHFAIPRIFLASIVYNPKSVHCKSVTVKRTCC